MGTVTTGRASGVGRELRADRYVWFTPGKGILSCGINLKTVSTDLAWQSLSARALLAKGSENKVSLQHKLMRDI
jgi:hypothetical protein